MLPNINNINYYLNNSLSTKPSFSSTHSKLKLDEKAEKKINNNE